MTQTDSSEKFQGMQAGMQLEALPGYLQYWEDREHNDPQDGRVRRIVEGLTTVALRGEVGTSLYADRTPALQARYWYRSLGPLNPMSGVEYDLITAARLMYDQQTPNPSETASLRLDSAYSLAELARISDRPETRRDALLLGLESVKSIKSDPNFAEKPAIYRLQTSILEQDLRHDAIRLRHSGGLKPAPMDIKSYRAFEKDFVQEELRGIEDFARLLRSGITDENFGVLFERFYIALRRHKAWNDEELDTIIVRGATSRENAEWTGEYTVNPNRITGNHDVVIESRDQDGSLHRDRIQLKTVRGSTTYHPRVTVLDFQEVIKQRFGTIDGATKELTRN